MIYDMEIMKTVIEQELGNKISSLVKGKKFKPIVSYTTRPIRSTETDGVEHLFITNDQADELLKDKDNILAYTKIGDNRYFALKDQLKDYNVYVIDPLGVKNLRETHPDIKIKCIYFTADTDVRELRFITREQLAYDDESKNKFKERNDNENDQFNDFEQNDTDHFTVYNNNPYLISNLLNLFRYILDIYTDDTLFCFIGRTAAGKDTFVKHLCELFGEETNKQ